MARPRTPAQGATIDGRIAAARDSLTPTERQLAEMLSSDPTSWAFTTVAELAERAATSGPTVIRFAVTLGFDGFSSLQDEVRSDVAARLRRPSDRIRQSRDEVDHIVALDAITETFDRLDDERIDAIAETVAGAPERVWIVASESSSPVAHLLAANLALLRPGVVHLTGSGPSTAASIADASANDAAIAIDFPRYEHAVVELATSLGDRGVEIVALTDGPLSPLTSIAGTWCGVLVPSVGPFDSATAIIAVAEVVIARVAALLGSDARTRLDAVESQWAEHGVFVDGAPSASDRSQQQRRRTPGQR